MVANKLEVETNKNRNDLVKWILAGIIFAGSILVFYYLDQYPLIYRILGLVGATLIDFVIVFNTEKIKKAGV